MSDNQFAMLCVTAILLGPIILAALAAIFASECDDRDKSGPSQA